MEIAISRSIFGIKPTLITPPLILYAQTQIEITYIHMYKCIYIYLQFFISILFSLSFPYHATTYQYIYLCMYKQCLHIDSVVNSRICKLTPLDGPLKASSHVHILIEYYRLNCMKRKAISRRPSIRQSINER